eukprot:NODE_729_length_1944_cov_35.082850_g675_i0.p1 GENE.NODE_729_length_1944_cov_35.082850_g675_i0~~NODE_729_length_1944_cov_35.082850_g675_i0.p1  ORF type:complete len:564 (+),score=114.48 NODE_729_length_1944_cov_35.082850_g675_i0:151-1842(+)
MPTIEATDAASHPKRMATDFLQPLTEVAHVWAVDVDDILSNYLNQIAERTNLSSLDINFAEAAVLVRNSVTCYGHKVDKLTQLVYNVLHLLSRNSTSDTELPTVEKAGREQAIQDLDFSTDFLSMVEVESTEQLASQFLSNNQKAVDGSVNALGLHIEEIPFEDVSTQTKKFRVCVGTLNSDCCLRVSPSVYHLTASHRAAEPEWLSACSGRDSLEGTINGLTEEATFMSEKMELDVYSEDNYGDGGCYDSVCHGIGDKADSDEDEIDFWASGQIDLYSTADNGKPSADVLKFNKSNLTSTITAASLLNVVDEDCSLFLYSATHHLTGMAPLPFLSSFPEQKRILKADAPLRTIAAASMIDESAGAAALLECWDQDDIDSGDEFERAVNEQPKPDQQSLEGTPTSASASASAQRLSAFMEQIMASTKEATPASSKLNTWLEEMHLLVEDLQERQKDAPFLIRRYTDYLMSKLQPEVPMRLADVIPFFEDSPGEAADVTRTFLACLSLVNEQRVDLVLSALSGTVAQPDQLSLISKNLQSAQAQGMDEQQHPPSKRQKRNGQIS